MSGVRLKIDSYKNQEVGDYMEIIIMFVGGLIIYYVARFFIDKKYNYKLPVIPSRYATKNERKNKMAVLIFIFGISITGIVVGTFFMLLQGLLGWIYSK